MSVRKKRRPKPTVQRLPIRPPFTQNEWKKMTVADVVANRAFLEYFGNCLTEAARSDRAKGYLSVLTGIMHFGRLPDVVPRSIGKFLAEAKRQPLSLSKLEIALEAILEAVLERTRQWKEQSAQGTRPAVCAGLRRRRASAQRAIQ